MSDQYRHPLFGMLADLLATPQGQRVASDYKTVQDAAVDTADYAEGAPDRAYARATGEKEPEGFFDVMQGLGDLALTAAPVVGGVKTIAGAIAKGLPKWASPGVYQLGYDAPIGPKLAKEAGNYTEAHREAAKEAMRRILSNQDQNLSRQTLKEGYEAAVKRKGLNVGPQGQQLDDMARETLRRLPDNIDLRNATQVEGAINKAIKPRMINGKPITFGVAGAVGSDAMTEDEDPQRAMLIDLIRRVQAGEV